MREAPLRLQIFGDWCFVADLARMGYAAVFRFENWIEPGLDREAREFDRVVGRRAPTQRTGHADLNIARAAERHGFRHLGLEVVEIRDARRRDKGNVVGDGDLGRELPGSKDISGLGTENRGRGGARRWRRRGRALHAGVHVALVVVANVEHVVVALEHAGKAPKADVGGAAIPALGDDARLPCVL